MITNEAFPPTAVAAASEPIRRLIERLAFQASRTAKWPSPEAVHDLRVAIRRMEQALVTFKPLLPRKAVKRIRKQLKAVLSSAGEVRDYDIAVKILLKIDQPGAATLRRDLRARRKIAERALLSRLKRLSLRTRVSRWFADLELHTLHSQGIAEIEAVGATALPRLTQRFFKAGESAASRDSGERLHEFRIQAKKLRYTLELFVPVYGTRLDEWIQEIKSVQSILGKMNDYRSVLAMATEAGCGKKLKASLKRSERRQVRHFRQVWAERFSNSVATAWNRTLQAGPHQNRVPRKPMASSEFSLQDAAAAQA